MVFIRAGRDSSCTVPCPSCQGASGPHAEPQWDVTPPTEWCQGWCQTCAWPAGPPRPGGTWKRRGVDRRTLQRPPSRALPEPAQRGRPRQKPAERPAGRCLKPRQADQVGIALYYEPVKLNRSEVGSSYPLRRTDGRFSRADCLLGCTARCGGCICPSVRAAAAVGMSAAAMDSEQGNSNSGSEFAVVRIAFVCICVVARAPPICRLASASRRARKPRATAAINLALQASLLACRAFSTP